jgi:FKBP-type peptidyl-prolyl cis-trans isomerase SlpA
MNQTNHNHLSTFTNPNEDTRIAQGSQVALHFSVALENGIEIDNTRSYPEPVSLVIGDGNLLEGFERALLGLRAGDRRTVHLPPEDAFGPWNPDNVQLFDAVQFIKAGDVIPEVGTMMEFQDKGGGTLAGVVKTVNEAQVEVDFNHPLAGRNVVFEVEIAKVTPAGVTAVRLG